VAAKRRGGGSAKDQQAEERRERLASALRDNLARRKAQARARRGQQDETAVRDGATGRGRDPDD